MQFFKLALLACTATAAALAADYLPLQPGNSWTYTHLSSGESFTIRVGTPLSTQEGVIYYRLTGYVDRPLWVRTAANGNLLFLDEETGRDQILTSFEDARGGWAAAPFRVCEQESQPISKSGPYIGPIGEVAATTELQYRSSSCADAGIEAETYAANLGLLRRVVTTIAGFRTFTLVEARIGHLTFAGRPAASFHAAVTQSPGGHLNAALRLTLSTPEPLTLVYPTSQDYDIVLWDSSGRPVHQWSEGRFFTQAIRTREVTSGLAHNVEIPTPLPDGAYILEAWLTAGPSQRAYSSLTPFRIEQGRLVQQ
ncbi:MAG: hypothetical protein HY821_23320 [Acidobacteria bacterium]|nr:hypothetical protein [Acidobacteriota bacterium]